MPSEVDEQRLLDDALCKGGVVWVAGDKARWFAWSAGRLLLVFGPDEQPDPGIADGGTTSLVVRSRDTHQRVAEVTADVRRLSPGDPDWDDATGQLAAARLNRSVDDAGKPWPGAAHRVVVLTPRLPLVWHA